MTIKEVSARYGLTPDTLRYYEKIGLLPPVDRTSGGVRNYKSEDCRWIEFIKCMRSAGLPVDMLNRYVDLFQQGDETFLTRKAMLIEQRNLLNERIAVMNATLSRLNAKIDRYENTIMPIEDELKKNKS